MDPSPIVELISKRQWLPLASVLIYFLVRLLKDDNIVPVSVKDRRWFPLIAAALAVAGSVVDAMVAGQVHWAPVAVEAAMLGFLPALAHTLGWDMPLPKGLRKESGGGPDDNTAS